VGVTAAAFKYLLNYLAAVSIMLRHHGMNDDSLRHVYKAVVISKLLYASPAWWEFTCVADWQRLDASIRRAVRSGFYASDESSMSQLVEDTDDKLFDNIRYNPHHVLHQLLTDKNDYTYNLRPRRHSFSLTSKTDRRSFVNRLLYKDIYYSNIILYPLYGCVLSTVLLREY